MMAAHEPLVLGVVGVSRKPDERRVPLHPGHLDRIPDDLRPQRAARDRLRRAVRRRRRRAAAAGRRHPRPQRLDRGIRRPAPAQAPARRPPRHARRPGALGVAAPRAGRGDDPARTRQAPHHDRVRGDEPLGQRRHVRAARLPPEQRDRRVLLGAARAAAVRIDGRLRAAADRGRHRLRCDRAWRGHRPARARRARRARAHEPAHGIGGRPDPRRADDPVRPRRRART